MHRIHATPSTKQLYASLLNGSALAVSDGSFYPSERVGACAWVISSSNGSEYIAGGGIIPGSAAEQGSYRSELGGQLGIVNVVSNLVLPATNGNFKRHITIVCDGLSALETVGKQQEFIKVKHKHADLIAITSSLWEASNFKFTKVHVKAHQDDSNRPLTINETLNCQMDSLAKKIAQENIIHHRKTTFHKTSLGFGTVTHSGNIISSRLQQSLYHSIVHDHTVSRLSFLLRLPSHLLRNEVHWPSLTTARKESSLPTKFYIQMGQWRYCYWQGNGYEKKTCSLKLPYL